MMLESFINSHDVDSTKFTVNEEELSKIEQLLGMKFGTQLKNYLLKYGYLGYESIELYGINSRQNINSDMISQTIYIQKYFSRTKNMVAIENLGEGQYALVDCEDKVFVYLTESDEMEDTEKNLEDYICTRFLSEDEE